MQGAPVPATIFESEMLSARVDGYNPADLDALCAAGEVVWCGVEPIGERDGRVALSVVDRQNPYRTAHVRGRVAETVEGEAALALIDRLAQKYTGEPFPMRSGTVYLVEVERAGSMTLPFRTP